MRKSLYIHTSPANIFLLLGMIAVISSFLFFGTATVVSNIILLAGLLISGLSYFAILFWPGSIKYKLLWTVIVIAGVLIQQATQARFIDISYSRIISKHEPALLEVCTIMKAKNDNIIWSSDSSDWSRHGFSVSEGEKIKQLLQGTGIIDVFRNNTYIFFRTYGMLDVSHGVLYCLSGSCQGDKNRHHITDSWYY